ncbi:MAG: protein kinase [Myxococcales bacterium]
MSDGDGLHPFGRYFLVERLRKGGMAEVYRAVRQGGDGTVIAIKRLLPQLATDSELVSMFLNEARLVAVLKHRHIAQVLDLGRVGPDYFIALEYVAGADLRALFARGQSGQPIPLPLLALVAAQICDALDFAHRKLDAAGASMGIVHRDVSPENILVSFDGEAKLIDFGVAKVESGPVKTQTGVLKGKFCYMSPEQVLALPLDRRSDLFSMGVVLYELATGQRLFLRESDFTTLRAVAQERIVAPGDLNPELAPEARAHHPQGARPGPPAALPMGLGDGGGSARLPGDRAAPAHRGRVARPHAGHLPRRVPARAAVEGRGPTPTGAQERPSRAPGHRPPEHREHPRADRP